MSRYMKQRSRKAGLPPGTLTYIGDTPTAAVTLKVMQYQGETLEEREFTDPRACSRFVKRPGVAWVNVVGVHDAEVIRSLGELFNFHGLVQEDILNTSQRPKKEDFENYMYIVVQLMRTDPLKEELRSEQVSIILGADFVLSFQEKSLEVFDQVRTRLRTSKGIIRNQGADYLAYALMDAVVDDYFIIQERLAEQVEQLEEEALLEGRADFLQRLLKLKRELIFLRKSVWPLREVLGALEGASSSLIAPGTHPYFRDVYDHALHIYDTVNTLREVLSSVLEIHISNTNNRLNEVMKVLTMIATIFIPLSFIVGVYGMNFDNMPELHLKYSYYFLWIVMWGVAASMLYFFKKNRWF